MCVYKTVCVCMAVCVGSISAISNLFVIVLDVYDGIFMGIHFKNLLLILATRYLNCNPKLCK